MLRKKQSWFFICLIVLSIFIDPIQILAQEKTTRSGLSYDDITRAYLAAHIERYMEKEFIKARFQLSVALSGKYNQKYDAKDPRSIQYETLKMLYALDKDASNKELVEKQMEEFDQLYKGKKKQEYEDYVKRMNAFFASLQAPTTLRIKDRTDLTAIRNFFIQKKLVESPDHIMTELEEMVLFDSSKKVKDGVEDINAIFSALRRSGVDDIPTLKKTLEKSYQKNGGVKYIEDATSVVNIVQDKTLQCYSGTSMMLLLARRLWKQAEFDAMNMVVIFTPQHIFLGQMSKQKDKQGKEGEDWYLTGYETTADGLAQVNFSQPLKNIDYYGAMRIIDASLFMEDDVFQNYGMEELLALTDQKYNDQIPLEKLEKLVNLANQEKQKQQEQQNQRDRKLGGRQGYPHKLAFGSYGPQYNQFAPGQDGSESESSRSRNAFSQREYSNQSMMWVGDEEMQLSVSAGFIARQIEEKKFPDPNEIVEGSGGLNVAMLLSYFGMYDALDSLLAEKKLDINKKTDSGQTLLQYLVAFDDPFAETDDKGLTARDRLIQKIIKSPELDVNTQDQVGMTPLMSAILFERQGIFADLLQQSTIDLTKTDANGSDVFMYAAQAGEIFYFDELVKKAEMQHLLQDHAGRNILHISALNPVMFLKVYNHILATEGANAVKTLMHQSEKFVGAKPYQLFFYYFPDYIVEGLSEQWVQKLITENHIKADELVSTPALDYYAQYQGDAYIEDIESPYNRYDYKQGQFGVWYFAQMLEEKTPYTMQHSLSFDVSDRSALGNNAEKQMMFYLEKGNVIKVQELLDSGASPNGGKEMQANGKQAYHNSPFCYAFMVYNNSGDLAQLLFDYKPDLTATKIHIDEKYIDKVYGNERDFLGVWQCLLRGRGSHDAVALAFLKTPNMPLYKGIMGDVLRTNTLQDDTKLTIFKQFANTDKTLLDDAKYMSRIKDPRVIDYLFEINDPQMTKLSAVSDQILFTAFENWPDDVALRWAQQVDTDELKSIMQIRLSNDSNLQSMSKNQTLIDVAIRGNKKQFLTFLVDTIPVPVEFLTTYKYSNYSDPEQYDRLKEIVESNDPHLLNIFINGQYTRDEWVKVRSDSQRMFELYQHAVLTNKNDNMIKLLNVQRPISKDERNRLSAYVGKRNSQSMQSFLQAIETGNGKNNDVAFYENMLFSQLQNGQMESALETFNNHAISSSFYSRKDAKGNTPLHFAADAYYPKHQKALMLAFLEAGAKKTIIWENADGETPLDVLINIYQNKRNYEVELHSGWSLDIFIHLLDNDYIPSTWLRKQDHLIAAILANMADESSAEIKRLQPEKFIARLIDEEGVSAEGHISGYGSWHKHLLDYAIESCYLPLVKVVVEETPYPFQDQRANVRVYQPFNSLLPCFESEDKDPSETAEIVRYLYNKNDFANLATVQSGKWLEETFLLKRIKKYDVALYDVFKVLADKPGFQAYAGKLAGYKDEEYSVPYINVLLALHWKIVAIRKSLADKESGPVDEDRQLDSLEDSLIQSALSLFDLFWKSNADAIVAYADKSDGDTLLHKFCEAFGGPAYGYFSPFLEQMLTYGIDKLIYVNNQEEKLAWDYVEANSPMLGILEKAVSNNKD
ncbi:MAG: ankyrin repeat domain-containing protein [Deltaproteobacteria bacterium]|nr:ankyrin repeat domain-containing protein [Deltaproteobacteria bacterium]